MTVDDDEEIPTRNGREPDGYRKDGTPYWFRPAFEPGNHLRVVAGNTIAEQHGAYSPRRVDPLATELVETVTPHLDWITPADMPAVYGWARAEAQVQLLTEYLERAGQETEDGVGDLDADRVKAAYALLHKAEARAASGRAALGLTPLARARLGRDVAAGQASAAQAMAARANALAEGEGTDGV